MSAFLCTRGTRATLAAIPLALAVLACSDESADLTGPAVAATAAEAAIAGTVPGQLDDVHALVAAFDAAWNAGSAAAYAALYTEDAEFINPLGVIFTGRPAIQGVHSFLFGNPFAGSTHTSDVRSVLFLTGTIAVVNLDVRLTGFVRLPPGLSPTQPGVLLSRERLVLVKRRGEWSILMNQVTAVVPAP